MKGNEVKIPARLVKLKVALVHDWLNGMRGGERVLEQLCHLFPDASLFTLHHDLKHISPEIKKHRITHSFIQHLPGVKKYYRYYLPLFPLAIRQFDFSNFDLVISVSHCAAKNILIKKGTRHLSYCLSPMRYVWSLQKDYFKGSTIKPFLVKPLFSYLKKWDLKGTQSVHRMIAISKTIQERILHCYGIQTDLIYPPCAYPFEPESDKKDYYLVLSALVPYKRIDLAIQACNELSLPLKIAGTGPELRRLKKIAGPTISFLGWVSEEEKKNLLRFAKALLFLGYEDFGIVPLEALSFKTPVIGFGSGGLTETVTDGKTGILHSEQTLSSMIHAFEKFNSQAFELSHFRDSLKKFSLEYFQSEMIRQIQTFLEDEKF